MIINRIFQILIILIFSIETFANSSPVNVSFLRTTGNVLLLKKASVELLSENLNITIIDDYTIVEVEYEYKNLGNKDEIWYGFPIDFFSYEKARPIFGTRNSKTTQTGIDDSKRYIKIDYFHLFENNQEKHATYWDTDSLYSIKTNFNLCPVYRRWYVGKIVFDKGQNKTIKIKYKIKNSLKDEFFPIDYIFSKREFSYHLFPSSNWGKGIVENFKVTVDFTYCNRYQINKKLEGLPFQTSDSIIYTFQQKNFDLKKSDRINIQYDNSFIRNAEFINESIKNYPIKISKIVTSSNNSISMNLCDSNPNTCWIGKVGDWIDIYFYQKVSFNWLNILNGDYSSQTGFEQYSKVKMYMLQRNGDEIVKYIDKNSVKINTPEYRNVNDSLKVGLAQKLLFWNCDSDAKKDIWHYRIYIQDFYKGKCDSVAISEIYFL